MAAMGFLIQQTKCLVCTFKEAYLHRGLTSFTKRPDTTNHINMHFGMDRYLPWPKMNDPH